MSITTFRRSDRDDWRKRSCLYASFSEPDELLLSARSLYIFFHSIVETCDAIGFAVHYDFWDLESQTRTECVLGYVLANFPIRWGDRLLWLVETDPGIGIQAVGLSVSCWVRLFVVSKPSSASQCRSGMFRWVVLHFWHHWGKSVAVRSK